MIHSLAPHWLRPALRRSRLVPALLLAAGCLAPGSIRCFAADAMQGKSIAQRWCAGCHLVQSGQKGAVTDQAPPFAALAARPDFSADNLAVLLLKPHRNMPQLALSRPEISDLADYILTLK
jgi:mono/diheme cytochrome c family protein